MFRFRMAVVFALSHLGVEGLALTASAQQVYTLEPPAEIGKRLDQLRKRESRTASITALTARDDAAPYLRLELVSATDKFYVQDLSEPLRAIEARVYERNRTRFAWWANSGRFDLCAELIITCPSNKDAVELADIAHNGLYAIASEAGKVLHLEAEDRSGLPSPLSRLMRRQNLLHFADEKVTIPRTIASTDFFLVRANTCELPRGIEANAWFVAVRSGVKYYPDGWGEWSRSTVLVNNSMSLQTVWRSMIVCDGDVVVENAGDFHLNSVIIANGDIRSARRAVTRSFLCATGDIVGVGGKDSLFHAGGRVTDGPSERSKEKQKELPFGVRFVDPARDFGLELDVVKGGLKAKTVAAWSPFAKFGVKDGDVVTKIDDIVAESIPAFRRQLRQGIIRESVVLHITRGEEKITRIVFLDGIPLAPAPMPREVER